MPPKLSTHVLDLTRGCPAEGMTIELHNLTTGALIRSVVTNADGRPEAPLLEAGEFGPGDYELTFHVGQYFGNSSFLNRVPVRFQITDPMASYHVPLLCTPWSYSTYRGS